MAESRGWHHGEGRPARAGGATVAGEATDPAHLSFGIVKIPKRIRTRGFEAAGMFEPTGFPRGLALRHLHVVQVDGCEQRPVVVECQREYIRFARKRKIASFEASETDAAGEFVQKPKKQIGLMRVIP